MHHFLCSNTTRSKEPSGVENVQAKHRGDDHGAVHDVEIQFILDDPTLPAVDKLNGSVHRSGLGDQSYCVEIRLSLLDIPDVYQE